MAGGKEEAIPPESKSLETLSWIWSIVSSVLRGVRVIIVLGSHRIDIDH